MGGNELRPSVGRLAVGGVHKLVFRRVSEKSEGSNGEALPVPPPPVATWHHGESLNRIGYLLAAAEFDAEWPRNGKEGNRSADGVAPGAVSVVATAQ